MYPYPILMSLLAIKMGYTIKWVGEPREDLMALMHSPNRVTYIESAVKRGGTVLGLLTKIIDNFGAYVRRPEPQNVTRALPSILGPYGIGSISIDAYGVFINLSYWAE